jgi:hypothetical protein
MKEPIQRYNQGFGGFGPLEKCNDGKLVKYEDHESRMDAALDSANNWMDDCTYLEGFCQDKDKEIDELKFSLRLDKIIFPVLLFTAIVATYLLSILRM